MHLPAAEVLHETCFSENYTPAEQPYYPHSGIKSGHPMEHQQHCAVPQMFQGVPLPLYCPLPTQNLTISRHMTQQPSNTHHPSYLPYLNVPNALSNEPGYGYHIPPNYISYNLPQFSQSQLPTFPPGQHAQVYFHHQPFIYGGDVQFAEASSMYGTFQDTAKNHKYPPPPAPHPFPSTQIIPQCISTGITSTPVLYRMLAMHPPGDKLLISAHQLEACLQKDLDGNVVVTAPHFFL